MSTPLLTLVIVTYNSASVVGRLLDSVDGAFPVVVVDNGSSDGTVALVSTYANVQVINSRNVGYGRGANLGFAEVKTPYAMLLNPDVVLTAQTAAHMVEAMEQNPAIGILGASMQDGRSSTPATAELAYVEWIVGALMLIRMDAFRNIGGFDENIFLFYEETDLCRRFQQAGQQLAVLRSAEAWHQPGNSSPPSGKTLRLRAWHFAWSKSYYHRKHFGRLGCAFKTGRTLVYAFCRLCRSIVLLRRDQAIKNAFELRGATAYLLGKSAFENGVGRLT